MATAPESVAVTVRATAPGFDVGRRKVGDVFEHRARVDEDGKFKLPSWLELASTPAPKKAAKPSEQMSLAQGAKEIGADLV